MTGGGGGGHSGVEDGMVVGKAAEDEVKKLGGGKVCHLWSQKQSDIDGLKTSDADDKPVRKVYSSRKAQSQTSGCPLTLSTSLFAPSCRRSATSRAFIGCLVPVQY